MAAVHPMPDDDAPLQDSAARDRLLSELRAAQARLRALIDTEPECVKLLDARGRVLEMNAAGLRMVEADCADAVIGECVWGLVVPEHAAAFRSLTERVCRGERGTLEFELIGLKGTRRWMETHAVPFRDEASGETRLLAITRDITARVEAEDKARRYADDVRTLVNRLVQAQEAERRRVADELHDLIGQNLTALGIDLQALKQQLQSRGDKIAGPRLDAMAALVETTINAIRGVMTDLRPAALEEFGLVPALHGYASVFSERTGIKVTTQVAGPAARLSRHAELALFRIVQETLTNVAKHSGARNVKVSIRYGDGVVLSVEDDGRGFADAAGARSAKRGGFGLTTMRERAEAHGGRLRVEFPGRGTRVVVEIPKEVDGH